MSKGKNKANLIDTVKKIVNQKENSSNKKDKPVDDFLMDAIKVFARLNQPFVIFDNYQKILYGNEMFLNFIGVKKLPQDIREVIDKNCVEDFLNKAEGVFSFEDSVVIQTNIRTKNKNFVASVNLSFLNAHEDMRFAAASLQEIPQCVLGESEALRSNELMQSILDYAPMAIYTRGAQGGLTFWNKKTMEIFDDNEDSVAARGAHENQSKEEADQYKNREDQIIKEGKVVILPQEPYTTRLGNKIMLHLIKVPIPARGGNPATVLTIAQDITERYIQEQEVLKTQNVLQTIFNNAPVAIYARDPEGNVLFRNKKTLEVHGSTNGHDIDETCEQKEFYKKRELAILRGKKLVDLPEEQYAGPDGVKRSLHAIKVPVFDIDGQPLMVITIAEDVTEKMSQERELLRTKNFLQEVINNLPVALYAKKYTGEYILWNKKSEDLFGKNAKEVIGKTHHNEEINPEQEEFIRMQDQKVFDVGSEVDIPQELISTQKDGIKIMHTVKTPLFYEDGTPNCLLGISEDITSKTKMEKQVYESRTKYSLLVENFKEGILLVENDKISFANKTLLNLLGYRNDDLTGKTFPDLVAPESMALAKEFYEKTLAGTAAQDVVIVKLNSRTKDTVYEFEISAAVAKFLGKKMLIMFLKNINRDRYLEHTLKPKDDKFKNIFEQSSKPLVILRNNGYVYEMNKAARDILGLTKEDKPFYVSVYVKPKMPLSARKAMQNLEPCFFKAKIDFDKLKELMPDMAKEGVLETEVRMTPLDERRREYGKVVADYLMELVLHDSEAKAQGADADLIGENIFSNRDALLLVSKDSFILRYNEQAAKMFGLKPEDVRSASVYSLFKQEDIPSLKADIEELYCQGVIKSRNYTVGVNNIAAEASAALNKDGNFLISMRNVTAKRQLLKELKHRSDYAQVLNNVIDDALLECDIAGDTFGRFTKVNAAACSLTGLTENELLSTSLNNMFLDESKKESKKIADYLHAKVYQLRQDKLISFEAKLQLALRTILAEIRISYYKTDEAEKAVVFIKDKSTEAVLARQLTYKEQELSNLKDALPGIYLKVNSKGIIEDFNTTDYNSSIAAFPSDYVGRKPQEYLGKETARTLMVSLTEAIVNDTTVNTSFSLQSGTEHKFYEASISKIKGEDKAIVLVHRVDKRKGLENKIHDLYTLSSKHEKNFVENMNDILEFGKEIFMADVGLICHFSGERRENIIINYSTKNEFKITRDLITPVECLSVVRGGGILAESDTSALGCKNCLHIQKNISSIAAAPLYVDGKVEGALCFISVSPNTMAFTEEDKNFLGFIGNLMSNALELRQAKKAIDNSFGTLRKLISCLDVPAVMIGRDFNIKNANPAFLDMAGIYDLVEVEDAGFFSRFTLDSLKAEGDFRSAYRTSKGGIFDISFDIILSDGRPFNILWHVVEVKDGKGNVKGFLLAGETIKDIPALKGYRRGGWGHI